MESDDHHHFTREGRIVLFTSLMIVLLLLLLPVCCCICHLFQRKRRRTQRAATAAATTNTTSVAGDGRLSPEARSSLLLFVYASMGQDMKLECAVCLMEFKEGEEGRLLPRCYHSFHTDCVDMWFDSHSTCPLCRSTVEPESPLVALLGVPC